MEIIPVYPEIHIKDIDKPCGQIAEIFSMSNLVVHIINIRP
jgi:hypothetical protein